MAESTYISFFAGAGGLDLGYRIAFPEARAVCYLENEISAAEILAANIESGAHHNAPIWSDVRTFCGREWNGLMDGIVAGFPCPDYSVAGKRAGKIGKHGQLWDYLAIAIRDVGPRTVWLENVSGILVPHGRDEGWVLPAGLWFVLGDLAAMGYNAVWGCIRASDVGASHQRLRWFALANRGSERRQQDARGASRDEAANGVARRIVLESHSDNQPTGEGAGLAVSTGRRRGKLRQSSERDRLVGRSGETVAESAGSGCETREVGIRPPRSRSGGAANKWENSPRNERQGSQRQGWIRRRVRQAGNAVGYTRREHQHAEQRVMGPNIREQTAKWKPNE